jgi:hypothetical protein
MITITENEFYLYDSKTKIGKWVKQHQFWEGDLTEVDFITDWRFREVEKRRKLVKLMGTIGDVKFPVQYPLILDDGTILNEHEKFVYNDEKE